MSTIDSAERDRMRQRLQEDLLQLNDLPMVPQTMSEILDLLGSQTSSAKCLGEVLERDSSLCAKTLRLANSAYFGVTNPVTDVSTACVVLGFDTVKSIAVGVTSLQSLTRRVGNAIDLDTFWRHSVGVAAYARQVARTLGVSQTGTAFCAGILHDLGKLVLGTLSARRYANLAPTGTDTLRELEVAEFGGDHQFAGAWLGHQWRFPAEILSAVRHHHEPWHADGADRWASMIHLADFLATTTGFSTVPWDDPNPPDAVDPRCLEILAMPVAKLDEIVERVQADLEKVESFVAEARS